MARRRLTRFEWACIAVIAASFVIRLQFLKQPTVIWDSAWFLTLARSFGDSGTFYLPWSEPGAPQYSGYWPPLFPIFVSPLVKTFGASYQTLVFASLLASALLTGAVYFCTRDLYGRRYALVAAAIVAANPAFYVSDSKGMSESLLALMVTLTVWAFLKSLDRPAWLPVAALFGLLAYLGKASLGLPFVAAGVLALGAWRVWRRGWRRVLTSPFDVGVAVAGLAFGVFVALTRTEKVGGLGLGLIEPLQRAVVGADCGQFTPIDAVGPQCWALLYPLKVAFVAAFLLVVTLPFSLRTLDVLRAPRSERTDALWLAVLLPIFAGAIFTTSFFFTEGRNLIDFDNIRYLTPAMVPFLWLTLPHWPMEPERAGAKGERVARDHAIWFGLAIGSFFLLELLNPAVRTGATQPTLGRFLAFLALSLIPLTFGVFAYHTQYKVQERRVSGGVEARYVPAKAEGADRRIVYGALAVLVLSAWFFSIWYVTVGVGLLVAVTTMSFRARAIAMALVLLGSAASGVQSAAPFEESAEALAKLPEGTLVGMSEQIVYPAAIAPSHIRIRAVDPDKPIPEAFDALLMQGVYAAQDHPNFTRVGTWDYRFDISPTVAIRLAIEEGLLGNGVEFQKVTGAALYVRNGSGLETRYST